MIKMINLSATVLLMMIISMSVVLIPSEKVLVVLPNEPTEVIYNVHTRSLVMESNFHVQINLSISFIDTADREKIQIAQNFLFEKSLEFQFNKSGFYLFTFVSPQLIQINFTDMGLKQPLFFVAILLILTKIGLYLWEAGLLVINPLGF